MHRIGLHAAHPKWHPRAVKQFLKTQRSALQVPLLAPTTVVESRFGMSFQTTRRKSMHLLQVLGTLTATKSLKVSSLGF